MTGRDGLIVGTNGNGLQSTRFTRRRVLLSLALASAGGLLAACAPAAAPSPTAPPAAPTTAPKLAAATAAPAAGAAKPEISSIKLAELKVAAKIPTYLADTLGYFKDEGLSVDYQFVNSGVLGLPLITAGQVDLSHGPFTSVFQAAIQGADYVFLTSTDSATSKAPDPFAVLVANTSPIQKVEDLAGKTVAVSALNSPTWVYLVALLKKHGVDPKQVKFVEVPLTNQADSVLQGQVDAASLIEPFHRVLLSSGKARAIAYPYVEITPGIDLGAWAVTKKWLSKNPNTAQAFARAYNRGKAYASSHEKETRDAVIKWTGVDPAVGQGMLLSNWRNDPADVASLQSFADLCADNGILTQKIDVKPLIYDTYANPPK